MEKMEKISFEDSGKLLRILDSSENNPLAAWITVSGTVPKSKVTPIQAIDNIRQKYYTLLKEFPTLRLKIITKEGQHYFQYAEDSEIQFDNLVKMLKGKIPLEDELSEWYEIDKAPLWRVEIGETEQEKTKIRVRICHGIIDGRGAFDVLDIFYCLALNEPFTERLDSFRNQPAVFDFGKKCWYTEEITSQGFQDPEINSKAIYAELNPPITRPSHVIQPQWEVPYAPISTFCRKHGVTAQAIVMAIQNEALRVYHQGKYDDIPIALMCPVDNRKYPYATELFKRALFYYHVGSLYPMVDKIDDPLENILVCSKKFQEAYHTQEACISGYSAANLTDEQGQAMNNYSKFLDPCKTNYTFTSHLGLVGVGMDNLQFSNQIAVYDQFYFLNLYGFHNKETFYFSVNGPYNCPEKFFQNFKDISMKYYNFIVQDVSTENN
ncbi:hypothetical protein BCR36DRAFT_333845 [Piromyces finnis]|uniref:Condensation domain-containing protein n=1 Tax=Piromyces finnis TaxID=1754191 RepID=A0A1Y1V2M0_9FUNG|nr:hypothetical protein BCR36DRAFT_333845 [Piromyces finnis]|eukprot:ORX45062.1 hypothetical protein BCR36DRAFT_333845 [Piromyces finnis]